MQMIGLNVLAVVTFFIIGLIGGETLVLYGEAVVTNSGKENPCLGLRCSSPALRRSPQEDSHLKVILSHGGKPVHLLVRSANPTSQPTEQPSQRPTQQPTNQPTNIPSNQPSGDPSTQPNSHPSSQPVSHPTSHPTFQPFKVPSNQPTRQPIAHPTSRPSRQPSHQPTSNPSTYLQGLEGKVLTALSKEASSLSTGAKVGIALGVVFGVLVVFGITYYIKGNALFSMLANRVAPMENVVAPWSSRCPCLCSSHCCLLCNRLPFFKKCV